ncbi:unnamed protein product [Cyclocybe aegerita]|uniref:Zn(2)-C6 fungal-type domain-containing protein n=1 Tax=Cyclocybe aegerita TaxID=1973307 RepID=A0A8S0WT75_CYCAE|nr:unnamed protein product [Cyclocybe aegerita]
MTRDEPEDQHQSKRKRRRQNDTDLTDEDMKLRQKFFQLQKNWEGIEQYLAEYPQCDECIGRKIKCDRRQDSPACNTCRKRKVRCPAPAQFAGWKFSPDEKGRALVAAEYDRLAPRYVRKTFDLQDSPSRSPSPSASTSAIRVGAGVERQPPTASLTHSPPGLATRRNAAMAMEEELQTAKRHVLRLQAELDNIRAATEQARRGQQTAEQELADMRRELEELRGHVRSNAPPPEEGPVHGRSSQEEIRCMGEQLKDSQDKVAEATENWQRLITSCTNAIVPLRVQIQSLGAPGKEALAILDSFAVTVTRHLYAQDPTHKTYFQGTDVDPVSTPVVRPPRSRIQSRKRRQEDSDTGGPSSNSEHQ